MKAHNRRITRTRPFIAALILGAILALPAVAQENGDGTQTDSSTAAWALGSYDGQDAQTRKNINALVQDGLIPTGMTMLADGAFEILYVRTPRISVDGWRLVSINTEQLESELTTALQSGWVPMDLSKRGDAPFVVLFVRSDLNVAGWRISSSETTTTAIQETLEEFRANGFAHWGISVSQRQAWHLFLDLEDTAAPSLLLDRLPEEPTALREVMNARIAQGYLPWSYSRAPFGPITAAIPSEQE